ncbi:MAG TPA: hypothetical protein DCQ26_02145 [Marinilabiliales bacterium]|nr:MAG: hypothetical protein A2W84_07040 [Bacteroidetes bacterium GWC2_40_13]OFX95228.1 MAG: hypothetical protein A2W97_11545 [Bacteroidetes bacterium GWE2_40_63]OFY21120.1 MAG: hypothetical protein A2W88_18715 [Bacteroidetes bacterium GWF2_40_13]OFZ30895.1 MAG: hypothetical protein A2437_11970 [Bacteroidetes bacterium RIFOXYC2_FULL_40_12]HAM97387.1 hypothetical protein [Marinilabiliales bacterium]
MFDSMNMRYFITALAIGCSTVLLSQNLVPNAGFEQFVQCPDDYGTSSQWLYVADWQSPTEGTPDYFNACSKKCGVPLNWAGSAKAYEGKAYMGIVGCMLQLDPKQISYREYIRARLTDTLEAGETYYASVQVRLALSCLAACNGLGIYFSSTGLTNRNTVNYPLSPQITYVNNEAIADKDRWTQICGTFTAKGDEAFIIIGNFLSDQQIEYRAFDENFIATQYVNPMAYYLIDDVFVAPFDTAFYKDCGFIVAEKTRFFSGTLEPDQKMVLEHLYFETDKWQILPESFNELNQLVEQMNKNPQLELNIHGHADQTGSEEHNIILSENRAIAVKDYLVAKGILPSRINCFGHGSSQPFDTVSHQKNRRVEIVVE